MGKLNVDRFENQANNIQKTADVLKNKDKRLKEVNNFLQKNNLPSSEDKLIKIPAKLIDISGNLEYRDATKDKEYWEGFKNSIERDGLLEKPTVHIENSRIIVDRGIHRITACKELGWKEIPCVVVAKFSEEKDYDNKFMENHHKKLNAPLVNAAWVGKKIEKEKMSYADLASYLGKKDKQWVARYYRIFGWSEEVKNYIHANEHAFPESYLFGIAKQKEMSSEKLLGMLKNRVENKDEVKTKKQSSNKYEKIFSDLIKEDSDIQENMDVVLKALKKMNLVSSNYTPL